MAKRKRPDPGDHREVGRCPTAAGRRGWNTDVELVDEAEEELGVAVRGAFDEGVLVGPMKEATGKSGSRLYQLKFALRDEQQDTG